MGGKVMTITLLVKPDKTAGHKLRRTDEVDRR